MTTESPNNHYEGACLCGAVTVAVDNADTHIHACHCSMCRTWSSSSLMAVSVASASFGGEEKITRYRSSDWAERGFCNQCGTNLFYHMPENDHYIICTGVFKDTSDFELTGEIFIDEKPAFYDIAGDHPRLTGEEFLASLAGTQG